MVRVIGKRKCYLCGTEISLLAVKRHERVCGKKSKQERKTPIFERDGDEAICPECGDRLSPRGAAAHWRIKHLGERADSFGQNGRRAWNRGLTADTDTRVASSRKKLSESLKKFAASLTPEKRKVVYGNKRNRGLSGGVRKGAGRGKNGWYQGYWCDSSWELAWAIYNIDHGIKFARNDQAFVYEYNGKKSRFFPDFRMDVDGSLVEIKGWLDAKAKAKVAAVKSLTVIGELEIRKYLKYAKEKFGEAFWEIAYGEPTVINTCADCKKQISKKATRCQRCAGKDNAKDVWPPNDILKKMATTGNWAKLGRTLGVSASAIRKRLGVNKKELMATLQKTAAQIEKEEESAKKAEKKLLLAKILKQKEDAGLVRHGISYTYSKLGCRCEKCRANHSNTVRKWKERQTSRLVV